MYGHHNCSHIVHSNFTCLGRPSVLAKQLHPVEKHISQLLKTGCIFVTWSMEPAKKTEVEDGVRPPLIFTFQWGGSHIIKEKKKKTSLSPNVSKRLQNTIHILWQDKNLNIKTEWGTCVHLWRIHVDVRQNQYNIVK